MASASENIEVKSSPNKITEKTVSDVVVEENGKQDECVTNGKTKSPVKSPQKSHATLTEDGSQLEDARSPQEVEVVEQEQAAAVAEDEAETTAPAAGGDAEKNGEATEVVDATAAVESNDVATPKTSPTKSASPLKKKAEVGDTADEPDVKKARRSLEEKAEADTENGTTADQAANGTAVEAAE